jgi:hypothetical protein
VLWVIVFAAIALAGLIMVVCYGVWLAHKASDVMSEVTVLAERGAQLAEVVGQISMPEPGVEAAGSSSTISVSGSAHSAHRDVG